MVHVGDALVYHVDIGTDIEGRGQIYLYEENGSRHSGLAQEAVLYGVTKKKHCPLRTTKLTTRAVTALINSTNGWIEGEVVNKGKVLEIKLEVNDIGDLGEYLVKQWDVFQAKAVETIDGTTVDK